jgi:hypothetical protein
MPAYLVRTIDSMTWSEFFAATSIVDLVVLVDEAVDADKCEYQRLGSGDIMWTGPAVAIPIEGAGGDDEEISEAKISWEGARFTESWSNVVPGFATVCNFAPNFTTRSRSAHLSTL